MIDYDDPGERGCGEKEPGSMYLCSGGGNTPLEYFLLDPPVLVSPHLDLPNKLQYIDPDSNSLMHWVGETHYPYTPDILEELRYKGASFRASLSLDVSRLSCGSRLLVAHPRAYNTLWAEQGIPQCDKKIPYHMQFHPGSGFPVAGPCLFKTYNHIPTEAGEKYDGDADIPTFYTRRVGDLSYIYHPTGEDASGLVAAFIANLPLTHITFTSGEMSQERRKSWEKAREAMKGTGVPYQTVRLVRDTSGKTHEVSDEE